MNPKEKTLNKGLQPSQILVLGFLLIILTGSVLLSMPFATKSGESIGFVNAFFTATSAVCVTGLVVVDTGSYWNYFGQTVIIILIQIGGLGFMTMASMLTLVAGRKFSLQKRILMQESMGTQRLSGVVRLTRRAAYMTFTIELIGTAVLAIRFVPIYGKAKGFYYAIFHSISAFCNAGFDILGNGDSVALFAKDYLVSLTLSGLVIIGGLGFMVIGELIKFRKFKKWSLNSKIVVVTTLILLILPTLYIFTLEYNNPGTIKEFSFGEKLLSSFFAAMTPRTAGFSSIDLNAMRPASLVLTMLLMFIGGSPSSTAGGVKTTTVALFFITIISILGGRNDTQAFGRRIPEVNVKKSIAIIGIAAIFIMVSISLLSITERDASFFEIVFETLSAYGTVGLSIGLTAKLSVVGKLMLSLAMFMGRVGALTLLFAATSKLKSPERQMLRYPEEQIRIG
ncbi:MAG: TrkH family potassium uptake protein [Bacillota bacterium]|nr:TrkH family potassium uptake protein [Bacillota bacterium]